MSRSTMLFAVIAVLLLITLPVMGQGVRNVGLSQSSSSGVSGTATTIVGDIGGPSPFQNVEVNMRLNRAAPANSIYEGWLIDSRTKAQQSLGVFQGMMLSSRMSVPSVSAFDQVAVSLEPANDMNPMPSRIIATGSLPGTAVASADFSTMAVLPDEESFQRQAIGQRFTLTDQQFTNLRMMGWSYADIAFAANIAARCSQPIENVTTMMAQGKSIDDIAASCNTTTAMLLTPVPMVSVAGIQQEETTVTTTPGMMYYRMYPNGRPVVSAMSWDMYQKMGYSWRDVAYAANISAVTGEDVGYLLRFHRVTGQPWESMGMSRGLTSRYLRNVDNWPFGEQGTMMKERTTTPSENVPPAPMGSGY